MKRKIAFVLLAILFAVSAGMLSENLMVARHAAQVHTEVSRPGTALAEDAEVIRPGFKQLIFENSDTVGWLKCGDTIDYPVVQSDNRYYLDHDFFGKYDQNGTLFVNAVNSMDDNVLLIHGHNMKNGAMFGTLKKYVDENYALQHPILFSTIYNTDDISYEPVCAASISVDPDNSGYFDLYGFVEDREEYWERLKELSSWVDVDEIPASDNVLVLVTCDYKYDAGRFLVVSVEHEDGTNDTAGTIGE